MLLTARLCTPLCLNFVPYTATDYSRDWRHYGLDKEKFNETAFSKTKQKPTRSNWLVICTVACWPRSLVVVVWVTAYHNTEHIRHQIASHTVEWRTGPAETTNTIGETAIDGVLGIDQVVVSVIAAFTGRAGWTK